MTEVDQNIAADDVTASAASAAADIEDDAEGISVDADHDASCSDDDDDDDDDDGVEVIGEDQDYYDDDGEMTPAQPTHGGEFYITFYILFPIGILWRPLVNHYPNALDTVFDFLALYKLTYFFT